MPRHTLILSFVFLLAGCGDSGNSITGAVDRDNGASMENDANVDVGFTPPADDVCIILSNPRLWGLGSDGRWSPGETATVSLSLLNICDESFDAYPGAHMESRTEGVTVTSGHPQLYGLLPDQPVDVEWTVDTDLSLAEGSRAELTASVTALGCDEEPRADCPPPAPFELTFTLASPITADTDCLRFSGLALRHYYGEEAVSWEPGARVAAEVVLTNHCAEVLWTLPAARLSADSAEISIVEPLYAFARFGVGDEAALAWEVVADPATNAGTEVTFTVIATTAKCASDSPPFDCPAPNPLTITRIVGGDLDPRN